MTIPVLQAIRIPPALVLACLFSLPGMIGAQESHRTVSVLYFRNTADSSEHAWLSKGLADMITTDFALSGRFTVIEREELQKILKEQQLALSGLVDESKAPRLGALLGATRLVYGSFAVSKDVLRIDAKVVDAESGAVVAAAGESGPLSGVFGLQRKVSDGLLGGMGFRVSDSGQGVTVSLDAARTYYSGLDLYDSGKYAEAVERFALAARLDPLYVKPGQGMEASYKFLKDFKRQRYQREMNALIADIAALKSRIAAPVFFSFADMVMNPVKFGFKDAAAASEAYQTRPNVYNGDTPVRAVWYLQNLFGELADLAEEYFQNVDLSERCGDEIVSLARQAEKAWPKDVFLAEVLYQETLVLSGREDWTGLKASCERLMGEYPDYRMMWAVEDFYERAIEHDGKGK